MNKQNGFSILLLTLIIVGVAVVSGGGVYLWQNFKPDQNVSACPSVRCEIDNCPGRHLPDENGCINCGSPCPTTPLTCASVNSFCGGIAGILCCPGLTCRYDGSYPDAGGTCVSSSTTPSITVTSPNGGETWTFGVPQTIRWASTGITATNFSSIGLYLEGPNGNCSIGTASISNTTKIVTLQQNQSCSQITGGNLTAGQYKLLIQATGNQVVSDESNGYFTITAPATTPSITVTSPNGGEAWQIGSTHTIQWQTVGDMTGKYVKLYLVNGPTPGDIGIVSASQNSFSWAIRNTIFDDDMGQSLLPGNYSVKAVIYDGYPCSQSSANCVVSPRIIAQDTSNNYFTITAQ